MSGSVKTPNDLHADPAYLTALAGLEAGRGDAPAMDPAKCSIAVLPFDNMTGDPEQEFFADGLAEDLLTELSRNRHLSAVSRNSSFVYKGKAVNAQAVGRELNADFILEGSVRRSGDRMRVTTQLIDCSTGKHVWAERFDRPLSDVFALQDEIVTAILGGLSFNLDEAAAMRRKQDPTSNSSAYTAFLLGRAAWRAGDEEGARGHLQRAIEHDANYAPALAYLSFLYAYARFSVSSDVPPDALLKASEEFAARALSAGGDDPFVLHRLADAKLMNGQPLVGRQMAERALKLAPRDIEAEFSLGLVRAFCGEHAAGLAIMEAAIRREARLPMGFLAGLADGFYLQRDYAGAIGVYDSFLDKPPYIELLQSASLAQFGKTEMARQTAVAAIAKLPPVFDAAQFVQHVAAMCALPEDAEHWREGFRKAGVDV